MSCVVEFYAVDFKLYIFVAIMFLHGGYLIDRNMRSCLNLLLA